MKKEVTGFRGEFTVTHMRESKVLSREEFHNDITNVGLTQILNVMFGTQVKDPAYYIGLIDNAGFALLSNTDTLSSHTGWAEGNPYVGDRKIWTPENATGQTITNAMVRSFDITADASVYGIFMASAPNGTTGTLWSTAPFSAVKNVVTGDTINITYAVSAIRA